MVKKFEPSNFPKFIRIEGKDVNLKFVFDNIRNIGIAALLFTIGVSVAKGEPLNSLSFVPYSEVVLGIMIAILGFILMILNLVQGILAVLATEKFNIVLYSIISVFLQIAVGEIFFRQVFKILG
ncbi:hypothetical protein [Vibrio sp. J383]|uniref:hypothetical protein n=1 Tax=Vibrio sp. J383 TaxID=2942997 RepID=UPI0020C1188F|nr:hypothetical protein [Vibrio sp. J383]UQV22734.1 hypothetical protein M4S28_07205 [Vibrio sp. J383]